MKNRDSNYITSKLRRWRHRRGFGVHSPFGFEVIKRVIRPENDKAYYAYEYLEYFLEEYHSLYPSHKHPSLPYRLHKKLLHRAKLLLRLCVFLDCNEVDFYNPESDAANTFDDIRNNLFKLTPELANSKMIISGLPTMPTSAIKPANRVINKDNEINKVVLVNINNTTFENLSSETIINQLTEMIDRDLCCMIFFDDSSKRNAHYCREIASSLFCCFEGGLMLNSADCHILFLRPQMAKQCYCF